MRYTRIAKIGYYELFISGGNLSTRGEFPKVVNFSAYLLMNPDRSDQPKGYIPLVQGGVAVYSIDGYSLTQEGIASLQKACRERNLDEEKFLSEIETYLLGKFPPLA
ncbi:hypothetical protein A2716_05135 [candidate division WWE3 bacterium RIFCSPHIGHO2_01_FULL_40_23]|uniref:Uncharacterized protein n=1 Tax=candidate division WWE3 bacterium RIFCSPLOWO2_01_FULL_41_18 TaxID=1802625 RepID=A0A1F4VDM6_UNCKA|nr:MAG: hypothetical protein A2716_05135 [candidate division WWE3 bacterium RIFCSPHIGHO2_01_FULL_40_23]OGC55254.1 MAG: hypothetical protein A3A78_04745 [candidate division WWE3 bacterium RIFCSPLOWO2_01_FULL_41_18]